MSATCANLEQPGPAQAGRRHCSTCVTGTEPMRSWASSSNAGERRPAAKSSIPTRWPTAWLRRSQFHRAAGTRPQPW